MEKQSRLQLESQVDVGSTFIWSWFKTTNESNKTSVIIEDRNTTDNLAFKQMNVFINLKWCLLKTIKSICYCLKLKKHISRSNYSWNCRWFRRSKTVRINKSNIILWIYKCRSWMDMRPLKKSEKPQWWDNSDYCNYGRNRKEEKNKCLKIGMNDYIAKPIVKGAIEHTL
jgi:hypothetical protein